MFENRVALSSPSSQSVFLPEQLFCPELMGTEEAAGDLYGVLAEKNLIFPRSPQKLSYQQNKAACNWLGEPTF